MSNSLDPDQTYFFVMTGLGPNCLEKLSADDTSRQNKVLPRSTTKNAIFQLKHVSTLSLPFQSNVVCFLICPCTLVANMAKTLGPDQSDQGP